MITPALQYQAIIALHERGYIEDFKLVSKGVLWVQQKMVLPKSDFIVSEYLRAHGSALGRQQTAILGILSISHGVKGILICHYPCGDGCWRNMQEKEVTYKAFTKKPWQNSASLFRNNLSLKSK